MRDGMFTTRADVYAQETPDTSDSVIVTSESALLQTSLPMVDYDAPDTERHEQGDRDETRVGETVDSSATFDEHPASSKRSTSYSEFNDNDHPTETIENDVCDASPMSQAVALSIAKSAFDFDPAGRSDPQTQTDSEPRLSRVQRNGFDTDKKTSAVRRNDNSCVVDCIYFTQQCCECVIF